MTELAPNKGIVGKQFKKEAKLVLDAMSMMTPADVDAVEAALNGAGYVLDRDETFW